MNQLYFDFLDITIQMMNRESTYSRVQQSEDSPQVGATGVQITERKGAHNQQDVHKFIATNVHKFISTNFMQMK